MVSGLNKLPAVLPFLPKKIFHPLNASLEGIVDKAETVLIAFDGPPRLFGLHLWKFMNRNRIFPLGHRFHLPFSIFLCLPHRHIHS